MLNRRVLRDRLGHAMERATRNDRMVALMLLNVNKFKEINDALGYEAGDAMRSVRDVAAGEELTHDWAMTDDDDTRMACRCRSAMCRGVVTGKDWQRPELQERYGAFMSSYLQEKIARSRTIRSLP